MNSLALNQSPDRHASVPFDLCAEVREPRVWNELITWMLFWPLLCIIAGQTPILDGSARTEAFYTQGAAAGPVADYHLTLYIQMGIQLALFLTVPGQILRLLFRNKAVLVAVILVFVSVIWSDNRGNTMRMGAEAALFTFFVCFLCIRFSPQRLMRLLIFMGIVTALLSAIMAIALPSYGVFAGYGGGAWQGICKHKNTLGDSMAFLLTPVFFANGLWRWQRVLYVSVLLFVIGMSQSKGAWICTVAMLGFVAVMHVLRNLRRHEALLFGIGVVLATLVVLAAIISHFQSFALLLGKDPSMSGRTKIYMLTWQAILERPLLGYGYGGFWNSAPLSEWIRLSVGWTGLGYAESGTLELMLQLGFVGVIVVFFMIFQAVFRAVSLIHSGSTAPHVEWFITLLFLAALINLDGGWLISPRDLGWAMVLLSCIGIASAHAEARTHN